MKYRCLNQQELQTMQQEFVYYLAANGITAPDWELIKENDPDRAIDIVEQFSDIVFDKVIAKVQYLEKREAKQLFTFHCGDDNITLFGLKVSPDSEVDLREQESINNFIATGAFEGAVHVFRIQKEYMMARDKEIFEMLDKMNCLIADGNLYNVLRQVYESSKRPG